MASVRVFSDLHIEFDIGIVQKCVDICSRLRTKYVILAGDITNFKKREVILGELVLELKKYTDHVIYVLGNHEYYEPDGKSPMEIMESYRTLCSKLGIVLLEDSYLETDDFVFYGATMWSNVSELAYRKMNDRYSFRQRQELVDIHENSVRQLDHFVGGYDGHKPLVIITHHLPSFTLIDKEYVKYGELNTGFASDLDHLIRSPPVAYWIYGHTHKPNSTTMNGVRLICNSLGYKYENKEFNDYVF